jgi:hypothetical protein
MSEAMFYPVPDFPGYFVNKNGDVFSNLKHSGNPNGEVRKLSSKSLCRGYCQYTLMKNGVRSTTQGHIIMGKVFLKKKNPSDEICHNNGIRNDNRLENLRYGSRKENVADMLIHGTDSRGEKHSSHKLNEPKIKLARLLKFNFGWSYREIADLWKINKETVRYAVLGITYILLSPPQNDQTN